jgi:hypothetical protein
MQPCQGIKIYWGAIRWQMLIFFAFFSVVSTILIGALSVAVLNVVIRHESAYLIEERIKAIVDNHERLASAQADRVQALIPNSIPPAEYSSAVWPGSQTLITVASRKAVDEDRPAWLRTGSFTDIFVNQGGIEIRSFDEVER